MKQRSTLADHLRGQLAPDAPACPDSLYRKSKARRESAAAATAQLELSRRAAELVDSALVRAAVAEVIEIVRQGVEGIPASLAPACAALSDVGSIAALLDSVFHDALSAIADTLETR